MSQVFNQGDAWSGFDPEDFTLTSTGFDNSMPAAVVPEMQETAKRLRRLLTAAGISQVAITSGYRSKAVNTALSRSVPNSRHRAGRAVDLATTHANISTLAAMARASGDWREILPYPDNGYIHLGRGEPFRE